MRRLSGTIQPYAWGSRTKIPELLGRPPEASPTAELWLGAHPSAPSRLFDGADEGPDADAEALDEVIAADPAGVLGQASVDAFGERLPYLLKLLAADQPLSLQAHPDRDQAEAGYARERSAGVSSSAPDRVFADDWPKPEMFVALEDVEALCGFRDPDQTYALFEQLGVPDALALVGPLADQSRDAAERLREVFAALLQLAEPDHTVVAQVVTAAAEVLEAGPDAELATFARTAVELDDHYAGDPGILAALLMNRVGYGRYQALFLPAGNLHAYLHGFGVEIMANSDNVLRGGLTSKFVAVEALLDILDFAPALPPFVDVVEEATGVHRYRTPAPEFRLWRVELEGGSAAVPGDGFARVLLVTDGELSATGSEQEAREPLELARGQALFVGPGERVQLSGSGTVFAAGPGLDGD